MVFLGRLLLHVVHDVLEHPLKAELPVGWADVFHDFTWLQYTQSSTEAARRRREGRRRPRATRPCRPARREPGPTPPPAPAPAAPSSPRRKQIGPRPLQTGRAAGGSPPGPAPPGIPRRPRSDSPEPRAARSAAPLVGRRRTRCSKTGGEKCEAARARTTPRPPRAPTSRARE